MSRQDDRRRNNRDGVRTSRLRERVAAIKPEDRDMIELLGVIKGIMDIIDDAAAYRVPRRSFAALDVDLRK